MVHNIYEKTNFKINRCTIHNFFWNCLEISNKIKKSLGDERQVETLPIGSNLVENYGQFLRWLKHIIIFIGFHLYIESTLDSLSTCSVFVQFVVIFSNGNWDGAKINLFAGNWRQNKIEIEKKKVCHGYKHCKTCWMWGFLSGIGRYY